MPWQPALQAWLKDIAGRTVPGTVVMKLHPAYAVGACACMQVGVWLTQVNPHAEGTARCSPVLSLRLDTKHTMPRTTMENWPLCGCPGIRGGTYIKQRDQHN